jgi:hypothetical protein
MMPEERGSAVPGAAEDSIAHGEHPATLVMRPATADDGQPIAELGLGRQAIGGTCGTCGC